MEWQTVLYYLLTFVIGMIAGGIMVYNLTNDNEEE